MIDSRCDKVRIIDELVIGKARADIVTVTKFLTGYEIKGDTDSYTRLPAQIKEYDRYFQKNYLVVGSSHKKSAAAHLPAHWGILCAVQAETGICFECLRKPTDNPKFSIKKQLALLWRRELVGIAQANKQPKYSGKSKAHIRGCLLQTVPHDLLGEQICEELFERDWTTF